MSTTVKLSKRAKKELDRLQAKITLQTGEKISQQELLDKIIHFVQSKEDEFLQEAIFNWRPLSDREWEQIKQLVTDFGKKTSEDTTNQELYGNTAG